MTTTDISLSEALGQAHYAGLTTFRSNGQPVATTIWFALHDGKAYFVTGPKTGKAKRIRRTARVLLGPTTARGKVVGPVVEGTARQLNDAEAEPARRLLLAKYGLQFRLLQVAQLLARAKPVYFEVAPA
jgi:PPOX class probable F420-dependent enzyme